MAKKAATVQEVRAWALENLAELETQGLRVGTRGKLSDAVKKAYTKATRRPIAP